MRILLVSQSKTDSGVPVWNRYFMRCFPSAEWWCWTDFPGWKEQDGAPEEQKVMILTKWLLDSGVYRADCPLIADGFWAAPINSDWVISVVHGIWDHDRGDFPQKMEFQQTFWKNHIDSGRTVVAVSDFIKSRFWDRWGWNIPVVGNSIDLQEWNPVSEKFPREKPIVIHGIKESNDDRKGSDILPNIIENLGSDYEVLLLNDACSKYEMERHEMLPQADVVLAPTRFEANSYFMLETLACNVPVVSYKTGLLWDAPKNVVGNIVTRYDPKVFANAVREVSLKADEYSPREWVSQYNLEYFRSEWSKILLGLEKKISGGEEKPSYESAPVAAGAVVPSTPTP